MTWVSTVSLAPFPTSPRLQDAEGNDVEIPKGNVIIERFEYYEYDKEVR